MAVVVTAWFDDPSQRRNRLPEVLDGGKDHQIIAKAVQFPACRDPANSIRRAQNTPIDQQRLIKTTMWLVDDGRAADKGVADPY